MDAMAVLILGLFLLTLLHEAQGKLFERFQSQPGAACLPLTTINDTTLQQCRGHCANPDCRGFRWTPAGCSLCSYPPDDDAGSRSWIKPEDAWIKRPCEPEWKYYRHTSSATRNSASLT